MEEKGVKDADAKVGLIEQPPGWKVEPEPPKEDAIDNEHAHDEHAGEDPIAKMKRLRPAGMCGGEIHHACSLFSVT